MNNFWQWIILLSRFNAMWLTLAKRRKILIKYTDQPLWSPTLSLCYCMRLLMIHRMKIKIGQDWDWQVRSLRKLVLRVGRENCNSRIFPSNNGKFFTFLFLNVIYAVLLNQDFAMCVCVCVHMHTCARPQPAPCCTAGQGACSCGARHWCRTSGSRLLRGSPLPHCTLHEKHMLYLSWRKKTIHAWMFADFACLIFTRLFPLVQLLASCQRRRAVNVRHSSRAERLSRQEAHARHDCLILNSSFRRRRRGSGGTYNLGL